MSTFAITPGMKTVRVALADDHAIVREGYRRLLELEPDFAVVAECADGPAVLALLQAADPPALDLLVLDLSMPGCSGLDLLGRITQRWPKLAVLVFSMHASPAMVGQALKAGAAGFVTKSSHPEALVQCLRRVASGERRVLSADIAAAPQSVSALAPQDALSPREFQVLEGLVAGSSLDEIAERLHLSVKTVANLQTQLKQKLGVNTAVELLHYARQHGLAG
jgi:DNA-binding NarL/FixJ family response regulator